MLRNHDILWMVDRQYANSSESRAITTHAMLSDQTVQYVTQGDRRFFECSTSKTIVPVGSVEFIRWAASHLLATELPRLPDYPEALQSFLGREVRRMMLRDTPAGSFVKPVEAKRFEAICAFDPNRPPAGAPSDTECWVCGPVRFREEYRVYVLDREAIGVAQYDLDSADRALSPDDVYRIAQMITAWDEQPVAWALDVGFSEESDDLLLVETNDGWATGFYPEAMSAGAYAEWLAARWAEIVPQNSEPLRMI